MSIAPGRSVLSKTQILDHYRQGTVVIHPFDEKNVNSSSVDVRLGAYYFRAQGNAMFNPFDPAAAERYWGSPKKADAADKVLAESERTNIGPDDRVIILQPAESVLAHTIEFIGGRDIITTELRAKSSMSRIGLSVSASGGWGDVGFYNRWTMLLTNHLAVPLVLVAGMRIAQIVFFQVDLVPKDASYAASGSYQNASGIEQLVREWHPRMMLPQLYKDRDIAKFHTFVS